MTKTASLLHTSQPNVSRWIALLEREVGFILFQKIGTRLVPTAEAEVFSLDVERVFLGFETLSETASSIRKRGTGVLRVGAVGSISMCVLPDAIERFRENYPDVPIVVNTGRTEVVANWAATGFCDIGFCSFKVDVANLTYKLINTASGVCIVHKGHRLAGRANVSPVDFTNENFISLTSGGMNRQSVDKYFSDSKRILAIETPYAPTICAMVNKGLGVSIVSPIVVRSQSYDEICEIPFSEDIPFESYCVFAEGLKVGLLANAFYSCVVQTFQNLGNPSST